MLSCDDATGPFGWMSRGACQTRIPSCSPPRPMAPRCARSAKPKQACGACLSFGLQTSQDGIGAEPPKNAVPRARASADLLSREGSVCEQIPEVRASRGRRAAPQRHRRLAGVG